MLGFLKSINFWTGAGLIAGLVVLLVGGWSGHTNGLRDQGREAARVELLEARLAQQQAASEYVVLYAEKAAEIRTVTKTIRKEVPIYVNPESDAACVVPPGFVRVHDAAAGAVPADHPSVNPDGAARTPALSDVADVVVDNYGICNETRERLIALQKYIRGEAP